MLAWSEGTDNGRQKTRNHVVNVIVGGELFTDYSDHPRKTCHAKPKTKSTGAGRYHFSVGGCLLRAGLERLLSEKSGRCGIAADWRAWRLPMIDRGDIRQAIDRCSNIWASLPGAGYGRFRSIRLTA